MECSMLLSPIKIGNLEIKNRFVVPPMGSNFANLDGTVTQQMIDYYVARAKGGFGLIIMEVAAVDPIGKAIICEAGLWCDDQVEGYKRLTDAVHAAGAKMFVQLHHAGRQTVPPYIGGNQPVAPSTVACPNMDALPHALTVNEVWETIGKFGDAAQRAKKAGFDGVEIHGAHGYLIAQFMSTHANKRLDEFGGDLLGRMKFPLEIIKDIKKKCGDDFPLSFRYSYDEKVNGGRTLEESTVVARLLEEAGIDVLHVSIMTYASMQWMSAPSAVQPGFNQYPTEFIKKTVNIPVISVGRYSDVFVAEDVIRSGKADMIAFGRESLADPEIPNKVKENKIGEISPCIACLQSCIGYLFDPGINKISCLVNPVTGHEGAYDLSEAKEKKKVLVVGAGPAGLEAAWTAAKRGHKVVVYEKEETAGGQFRLAAVPPTKHEILKMLKFYITMGKKYGVDYKYGVEVDESVLEQEKPDAVILATGGVPLLPNIPGINNEAFASVRDILGGFVAPGRKVLIVGGGMSGAETADFLGEHNRSVTIIDMLPEIAQDVEGMVRGFLMQRLEEHHVNMVTGAKVKEFYSDGVLYCKDGQDHELRGFDTIVLSMGVKSYNPLEEKFRSKVKELYVVGDALKACKANHATETGLSAALKL